MQTVNGPGVLQETPCETALQSCKGSCLRQPPRCGDRCLGHNWSRDLRTDTSSLPCLTSSSYESANTGHSITLSGQTRAWVRSVGGLRGGPAGHQRRTTCAPGSAHGRAFGLTGLGTLGHVEGTSEHVKGVHSFIASTRIGT